MCKHNSYASTDGRTFIYYMKNLEGKEQVQLLLHLDFSKKKRCKFEETKMLVHELPKNGAKISTTSMSKFFFFRNILVSIKPNKYVRSIFTCILLFQMSYFLLFILITLPKFNKNNGKLCAVQKKFSSLPNHLSDYHPQTKLKAPSKSPTTNLFIL